jgi:hypothetical protein
MPKIADHTYSEALRTGKCMVGKHSECTGTAVISIHALRRHCDCQCHSKSE